MYIYIYIIIVSSGINPPFINNVISYWLSTHLCPTLQHLSLSLIVSKHITSVHIKPCYDRLMKAIDEWGF